jgi:hypothetical protein
MVKWKHTMMDFFGCLNAFFFLRFDIYCCKFPRVKHDFLKRRTQLHETFIN